MKRTILRALAILAMGVSLLAQAPTELGTSPSSHALSMSADATTSVAPVAAAKNRQQVDAEAFYHRVWELGRDNFLWTNRQADWATWEHKFDGQLNSQADAERAVNQLLGTLGDPYTYYKNATVTASRGAASQATNVVTYRMLPGDIAYIRIRTFGSQNTSSELEAALKATSTAKAYILDLRDNGGGYVWQAFRSFALMADSGTFTTLRGRSGGAAYTEVLTLTATELIDNENNNASKSARPKNLTGSKPIVILVNGDTASASEMLTGALQDNGRATVVGTLTFGKGIAQNTWDLAGNTSVQITFAQYYFPSGVSIHKVGITPTHVVNGGGAGDAQLDEAVKVAKTEMTK